MKKSSIKFLQFVVILVGVVAAGLLLWEPWREGVNAGATTLAQIYFDDPFLALVYAGSIPFFIAVYQAVKLLGYAGANQLFSTAALRPLRVIKGRSPANRRSGDTPWHASDLAPWRSG